MQNMDDMFDGDVDSEEYLFPMPTLANLGMVELELVTPLYSK